MHGVEKKLKYGKSNKLVEPCKYRFKGICRHANSSWYGNYVVGEKSHKCKNCRLYEN